MKTDRMKDMYTRCIFMNAVVAVVAMMMAAGCGQRGESVEMGPGETVEAFCRAMAAGEFDDALALCDTVAMKDYIGNYATALKMQMEADSSVAAIAAGLVSRAEMTVDEVVKDGDRRLVHYTVTSAQGTAKAKTAKVRKEEGAWRVEAITDRN